ncbi:MAG: AAA family ATPase [Thermoguttaceae bacterium]
MIVSYVKLLNWRNFLKVEANLGERIFLIGPNASGKSNFLDVFRFLRDIAKSGGGLQKAIDDRGGVTKIRCLAARRYPDVEIEIHLADRAGETPLWKYALGIKQRTRGDRKPYLTYERVWQEERLILNRPDEDDQADSLRLTETHLEQIIANAPFRRVAEFLKTVLYLHLVPQLVRHPREFSGPGIPGDPFGRSFLERIAQTPEKTRKSRLKNIERALRLTVPQLRELTHVVDAREGGVPHLEAVYDHWRPHGARQRESDFSDGTLRLIGLLWSLLETDSLLLLEEPELSLNTGIVTRLPSLISRMQRKRKRQIIISTHSADILMDKGVGGEEALLLSPSNEGTQITVAADDADIRNLLESGFSVAEAALPRIVPESVRQLQLFE